jgi:hypothetical protein
VDEAQRLEFCFDAFSLREPVSTSLENALVPRFRLHDGLANLRAATGAFVSEVDLRHAPVRLDVTHKHRNPDAARTDDKGRFDMIVLADVGWHVGSPQKHSRKHFAASP